MVVREQRHSRGRLRTALGWFPDVLVVVLVVAALANLQFDLAHRWLGLDAPDPERAPAEVLPPAGLDLAAGAAAPAVATAEHGGQVSVEAVRRALAPHAGDASLGPRALVAVAALGTGEIVFDTGPAAVVPASTTKLLTTAAALQTLGPTARFTTSVRQQGRRIVLVGGGDPFLASTRAAAKGLYPSRATLDDLAARTATALAAAGRTSVRLGYDDSLFTGPAISPAWRASYVPDDVVPPITALWADQGEGPDGRYVADPALVAAGLFAEALGRRGITVRGPLAATTTGPADPEIASVRGATLDQVVERINAVSDNNAAEVLMRHVGRAVRQDASFTGGAAAVLEVLGRLGIETAGSVLHDGSGLSRRNRLTPQILLGVLSAAAADENPRLRPVLTGLPVAGFLGSLQSRFDDAPAGVRGRVRAKTGTLTGVHGLAGVAVDVDGNQMAFVAIADRVAVPQTLAARRTLDRIAAALGACRCGVGGPEAGSSAGATS